MLLLIHNVILNIKTIAFIFISVQIMGCLMVYLSGPLQGIFTAPSLPSQFAFRCYLNIKY